MGGKRLGVAGPVQGLEIGGLCRPVRADFVQRENEPGAVCRRHRLATGASRGGIQQTSWRHYGAACEIHCIRQRKGCSRDGGWNGRKKERARVCE